MTEASERREQRRHLNDSLLSGSLSRREYDELLPFVLSPSNNSQPNPANQDTATRDDDTFATALAQAQHPNNAGTLPSDGQHTAVASIPESTPVSAPAILARAPAPAPAGGVVGLQLRCPGCGTCNDPLRRSRCDVCNSRLTIGDELSATATRRSTWPIVAAVAPVVRPTGEFTASEDGRVLILDGFFSCQMQGTQTIATSASGACEVFVMCCRWEPRSGAGGAQSEATWYVSQRFSQFERLHKALKRRLSRSSLATLPPFPAKYHFTGRLEKRKQDLAVYMPRLLEMCAHLPHAQATPELDEFLDVSHQVHLFRAQRQGEATVPASVGLDALRQSTASTSTATASTSSPFPAFPAFAGPANPPPLRHEAAPMDAAELAQAEGAVRGLADGVRRARGDVRGDGTVQHHLDVCVQLAPALQRTADLDNPFANTELIPRAMQCLEDLQQAVALYNDALLAVSEVAPRAQVRFQDQQAQHSEQEPLSHAHSEIPALQVRNVVPASAA